tara:strand:+ start:463 stop:1476 length:1014 start_codon:yes stop_codon:yes gene_type:complete
MKNVVHVGPFSSRGGMSSVIQTLSDNPPDGWSSGIIDTYSGKGIFSKAKAWLKARMEVKRLALEGSIDIAHIHVTHSLSWWRKRDIMQLCDKIGIKVLVHIHSGKFDKFCRGLAGKSVKEEMNKENRKVVVLENRWLEILDEWLPKNSSVVPNSIDLRKIEPRRDGLSSELKILMLSRKDSIKGHRFALDTHRILSNRGIKCRLIISGVNEEEIRGKKHEGVEVIGWVSEEEKWKLLGEVDFVLSPSEFEGSSMTVIESITSGVPCICSLTSAETIGIDALTLDLNDPNEWANKIVELSNPRAYREIENLLRKQKDRFDIKNINYHWNEIYDNLVLK